VISVLVFAATVLGFGALNPCVMEVVKVPALVDLKV
tara:strand:+ start:371 stop:478 length:108 start_codon:yes stop_codon:yes gene_type:complete